MRRADVVEMTGSVASTTSSRPNIDDQGTRAGQGVQTMVAM